MFVVLSILKAILLASVTNVQYIEEVDVVAQYAAVNQEEIKIEQLIDAHISNDLYIGNNSYSFLTSEIDMLSNIQNKHLVAHAGGELGGYTYTNAKEALDLSYKKGFRLMEVDFEWTTDGEMVCVHSWDGFINNFFGVRARQYSYDEFISFNMINGWNQLTLHSLALWLENHPDAYIVTDIKRDNIRGLKTIKMQYPHLIDRIIPQIYSFDEYEKALALGYKNIILTLYRIGNTNNDEIVEFAKNNSLFAVTMPESRARGNLPKRLKDLDVYTYAHTINDINTLWELMLNGVDGIYTDKNTFD